MNFKYTVHKLNQLWHKNATLKATGDKRGAERVNELWEAMQLLKRNPITIIVSYPSNEEGWYDESKIVWAEKEITIHPHEIQWMEPTQWGNRTGMRVYILPAGETGNHWHLITSKIIFQ